VFGRSIFSVLYFQKCKAKSIPMNTVLSVRGICARMRDFTHLSHIHKNCYKVYAVGANDSNIIYFSTILYNNMAGSQILAEGREVPKLAPLTLGSDTITK
jgi:hypothetical protein